MIWFTLVFVIIVLTESNSLTAEILLHASSLFGVLNPAIKLAKSLLGRALMVIVIIAMWVIILIYYAFWPG